MLITSMVIIDKTSTLVNLSLMCIIRGSDNSFLSLISIQSTGIFSWAPYTNECIVIIMKIRIICSTNSICEFYFITNPYGLTSKIKISDISDVVHTNRRQMSKCKPGNGHRVHQMCSFNALKLSQVMRLSNNRILTVQLLTNKIFVHEYDASLLMFGM